MDWHSLVQLSQPKVNAFKGSLDRGKFYPLLPTDHPDGDVDARAFHGGAQEDGHTRGQCVAAAEENDQPCDNCQQGEQVDGLEARRVLLGRCGCPCQSSIPVCETLDILRSQPAEWAVTVWVCWVLRRERTVERGLTGCRFELHPANPGEVDLGPGMGMQSADHILVAVPFPLGKANRHAGGDSH